MNEIIYRKKERNEPIHSWWVCVFKHCVRQRVTVHHWINFFIAFDSNYWITRHISQWLAYQYKRQHQSDFSCRDFYIWKKTHCQKNVSDFVYLYFIWKTNNKSCLIVVLFSCSHPSIIRTKSRDSIPHQKIEWVFFINIQRYELKLWQN